MICTDKEALEEFMKLNLKDTRYRHSLGVEKMAVKLAQIHGADIEKAAFAGRYHDIAKNLSPEEMDERIIRYGLPVGLLGNNALAHSKVGAAILEHEFGVTDKEVLDAVRYHTTAKSDMPLMTELIFVADVVEDNRTYHDLPYYQDLACKDLDRAAEEILEYTINDLKVKGRDIHRDTLEAYDYLINKRSKNGK